MTAQNKKFVLPKPPYAKTLLPGGPDKIIRICEDLRTRNKDGYLPSVGGVLANVLQHGSLPYPEACNGTTCSPFTATVIGVAFDPTYPRDDLHTDPYVPMFNGGKDPLMPFAIFYSKHNSNNGAVKSVVDFNLGTEIDQSEVRRGDLVEIEWVNKFGHVVFCWDVHLDANGKVDAIQIIGSNGPTVGVSIHGCSDERWLTGKNAVVKTEMVDVDAGGKTTKKKKVSVTRGNYTKTKPKIFVVGDDEIVKTGVWYGLPGVKHIDTSTFRVPPGPIVYAGSSTHAIASVRFARFHYEGAPPKPGCMRDGPAPAQKPGHTESPAVVVKAADIQQDHRAPQKVPPQPAKQEKGTALKWQRYVEAALQAFYRLKWIDSDPGKSDDINDAKTQAALKEFQAKFRLDVDGKIGPQTLGAINRELPMSASQYSAQLILAKLYDGKKLQHDPGIPDGLNNQHTRDALEEFQKANGLLVTKVPDSATVKKLLAALDEHKPTAEKPGLKPELDYLYWLGSPVAVGGTATLRLHSRDLKSGEECVVHLYDEVSKKEVESTVKLSAVADESEAVVPIPFGGGALVHARVVSHSAGEISTHAALHVGGGTETAKWRAYIGQDAVPDDILETIRRNRAQFPAKTPGTTLPLAKGKWAAVHHYDYVPGAAHQKWARAWVQQKIDAATTPASKHVAQAFMLMLRNEGYPASLQTYDNQIVTWGVGLGGKGDGVHAFTHLHSDPGAKKLLDDLGLDFDGTDYHVVDLTAKKVVSSAKGQKGNDARHVVALDAWRRQPDLLSAIIGISEDPASRLAVAESQWAVYLSNSTQWGGQDKIASLALYFMVTHMMHWLPAIAKGGIHVEREFAAIGGSPSIETDKRLAPRLANSFRKYAVTWCEAKKAPGLYKDIHGRIKTSFWSQFRKDAAKEGYDPGELVYDE